MQYSMKKLTVALIALCMVALPGSTALAANDDTITTRSEAQVVIAPLVPALSGALTSLSVSMNADRAALAQVNNRLAVLAGSLVTLQASLRAGANTSTAEDIVTDISSHVSLIADEVEAIHARQETRVNILDSIRSSMASILSVYLALPA